MKSKFEIHPIQARIIRVLTFHPRAKFGQLNEFKFPTDQFTFHINALTEAEIVEKIQKGLYQLTVKGKEFANRFDTDKEAIEKQAKISVIIGCVKKEKGQKVFLIQQRLKQPYYGYHGFISGKISLGETPIETASRELTEETGLTAQDFKLVGIRHKMDYSKDSALLEDKYFFIIKANKISGTLTEDFEGGQNKWLTSKQISELENIFDGVDETLDFLTGKPFQYTEHKFIVSGF